MPRNIYGPDHEAFRSSVREFVERTLKPRAEQMLEVKSIDRDIWKEAGKQGLFGLDIPEEFGGMGADDYRFNAIAAEEIAGFNFAVSSCFGIHSDVCPPYIVDLGTQEQKERWLPGHGHRRADLRHRDDRARRAAPTSPPSRPPRCATATTGCSTAPRPSSPTATRPTWSSSPPAPTRPRAPRASPCSWSRPGMEGFSRGRKLDKVGQEEADTAELFFEDVRVPDANRLGDEGLGFIAMMQRLPQERVGAAVRQHRARLPDPPRDDRVRQGAQGVRPADRLVPAQQVQDRRAGQTKLEVTQAYVDDCIAAHAEGKLTAVDAAKAKWWSAQVQNDVLDECVQLYGGYGFMNEYRVARAWRDARVTKIWAGSNEIMKELIGRDLGL